MSKNFFNSINTILVTGGLGFIGSAYVKKILQDTKIKIVNIDKEGYASNKECIDKCLEKLDSYKLDNYYNPKFENGIIFTDPKLNIKLPKLKQDLRADLPTIGLETIKQCRKVGLKGLVLKAKQNIFLDKQKSISYANKNNMFIKVER